MAEGLELVPSTNAVGFRGVFEKQGRYKAAVWEDGEQRYLDTFSTVLREARHVGAARAVAEATLWRRPLATLGTL